MAPGLTEHAHRVWTDENAGGSSRNSEAMSMELLRQVSSKHYVTSRRMLTSFVSSAHIPASRLLMRSAPCLLPACTVCTTCSPAPCSRAFGAILHKTEMQLRYFPSNSSITDMSISLAGVKLHVENKLLAKNAFSS